MYELARPRDPDLAFVALADPTRRAILVRLARGEATIGEIAKPFPLSQPAISQHVKLLVEAGFVAQRSEGTRRPCRLSSDGLAVVDLWLATLRKALEANYARLDDVLADTAATKNGDER